MYLKNCIERGYNVEETEVLLDLDGGQNKIILTCNVVPIKSTNDKYKSTSVFAFI